MGDRAFSHHVVEINQALRFGYQRSYNEACLTNIRDSSFSNASHQNGQIDKPFSADIVDDIRQQLHFG